jgi:hypothetical protein
MDRQIGQVNCERTRTELNDAAGRTVIDGVLDVGEVVLTPTERFDRRANGGPIRNAADARQSRIPPIRESVVICR